MENHQLVLVLDFGGQYNQLIARRVREHNVFCEVKPYKTSIEEIKAHEPDRHYLHRRPEQRLSRKRPRKCDPALFDAGRPGARHLLRLPAHGAHTSAARSPPHRTDTAREYGKTETFYDTDCKLFKGLPGAGYFLDEPRRLHGKGAGGLRARRAHRRLPDRRHR